MTIKVDPFEAGAQTEAKSSCKTIGKSIVFPDVELFASMKIEIQSAAGVAKCKAVQADCWKNSQKGLFEYKMVYLEV